MAKTNGPEAPAGTGRLHEAAPDFQGSAGRLPQVPESRVVLDAAGIQRALTRIAHEIVERNPGAASLTLVAILKGGLVVAQRIAAALRELHGLEVPLGALDVTLPGAAFRIAATWLPTACSIRPPGRSL